MSLVLAQRIRELRKNRNLTQKQVAQKLHVAQTTIANYENATRLPDLEKLTQLSILFEVTVDYLLGKELQLLPERAQGVIQPEAYFESLRKGDKSEARAIVLRLLQMGLSSQEIYRTFMQGALYQTGDLWESGKMAVWQEHLISEMIQNNMALIKGARKKASSRAKRVLCLLPGAETHLIGLRMMGDYLEEQGHQVHFLGNAIPADNVIDAIMTLQPDFVLLSVTREDHVASAKALVAKIQTTLKTGAPKVIIGGRAFAGMKQPQKAMNVHAYCKSFEGLSQVVGMN